MHSPLAPAHLVSDSVSETHLSARFEPDLSSCIILQQPIKVKPSTLASYSRSSPVWPQRICFSVPFTLKNSFLWLARTAWWPCLCGVSTVSLGLWEGTAALPQPCCTFSPTFLVAELCLSNGVGLVIDTWPIILHGGKWHRVSQRCRSSWYNFQGVLYSQTTPLVSLPPF